MGASKKLFRSRRVGGLLSGLCAQIEPSPREVFDPLPEMDLVDIYWTQASHVIKTKRAIKKLGPNLEPVLYLVVVLLLLLVAFLGVADCPVIVVSVTVAFPNDKLPDAVVGAVRITAEIAVKVEEPIAEQAVVRDLVSTSVAARTIRVAVQTPLTESTDCTVM